MDPSPPLPPIPTTIAAAVVTINCTDFVDSSPRSRQTDTWEDPLPPVPGAKLRLMCSYGGHIIPRPHDKSLCYVGGDTRIVVADRHSVLSDLCSRLSRTLLHGRHFTLKYQLPNEELDSLVSITTDEDLENMIEEYDRLTSACSSLKPARLRLFLFPSKPETAASMGSLLDDAKSETWFVDALNGTGFLPRGLSDSATMDNLLELDDGGIVNASVNVNTNVINSESNADFEAPNEIPTHKIVKNLQDVHSNMPDSPIVETNSSFGSSSSSPTMSNLPPIRVRVDESGGRLYDQMAGLDEHLSQMTVGVGPPPLPMIIGGGGQAMVTTGMGNSNTGQNEHLGRVLSDDERSDHGAPSGGFRKPPLPLQPVPRKLGHDPYALPSPDSKQAGGYSLTSPDSVTSDCSIASATSFSKHPQYQDPTQVATRETRAPSPQIFPIANFSDPPNSIQDTAMYAQTLHQNQPPQHQQQQFYHPNTHYIHQPGTPNPVPISSYYPVYATSSQQQQPQHHQQMEPQYQMYYMPVPQNQPYNHPMQPDAATNTATGTPATPPLYPTKPPAPATTKQAEMVPNTPYRTTTPTPIQVPANQYQQQYMNMPPPHYPPAQGYEYGQQGHEQVNYYPQHSVVVPSQYQTMTSATAVMLSQVSAQQQQQQQQQQQAADNAKQQTAGNGQQL